MRRALIIILAVLSLTAVQAQNNSAADNDWAARTALRLMIKANNLQMKNQYLEAMDSATLALSIYGKSDMAKNFIHKHWDQTMRTASKRLVSLNDLNDLGQAYQRVLIYRYLVEIYDNLRYIKLPLHGPKDRWVWQPEIQYWNGHFEDELKRVSILEDKQNGQTHD